MALMERQSERYKSASADSGDTDMVTAQDPLTFDPTQGRGSPAWQQSLRMNMELNARRRRN